MISVEVNLGSHVHGFPQIGVAQIGPVINTSRQKSVPVSAQASAAISYFSFLVFKNSPL